jgi:hypothetical protein
VARPERGKNEHRRGVEAVDGGVRGRREGACLTQPALRHLSGPEQDVVPPDAGPPQLQEAVADLARAHESSQPGRRGVG